MVSLDEARAHLRYDGNDNDAEIAALIAAADAMIRRHCDKDTDFTLPNIKHAALLLIGFWDENRAAETGNGWYLPPAVLALLTPYRTPTAV